MTALERIRVVDFSRYGPGRQCTMFLADFGAEVITVETPRNDPNLPAVFTDDLSPRYLALNRNKKSLAINLRVPDGKEVIYRLVKEVDVVVEGFRPGTMEKLGLDYDTLKKLNPQLIYCSLSGFGQDGPYSLRPGHDVNYLGLSGILDLTRGKDGNPVLIGTQVADLGGGASQAVMGILLALLARQSTGKGQCVDISMFDGIIAWHWTTGTEYLIKGKLPRRFLGESPAYNIYRCKDDKHITLGIMEPWFWESFCRAIKKEDFIPYMEASEKSTEIIAELEQLFSTRNRDEWIKLLSEIDIPYGPVNTIGEALADPQTQHRRMVLEVGHPRVGKLKLLGVPIKLSETPGEIRTPAPAYGEYTAEILRKLGYNDADLKRLRETGAIE